MKTIKEIIKHKIFVFIFLSIPIFVHPQSQSQYNKTRTYIDNLNVIDIKDSLDSYVVDELVIYLKNKNTVLQDYSFSYAISKSKYSLILQLIENGILPYQISDEDIVYIFIKNIYKNQNKIETRQLVLTLKTLIKYSNNINYQDPNGMTCLHYSMLIDKSKVPVLEEIIKFLIENKIDITKKTKQGFTACDLALENIYPNIKNNVLTLNNYFRNTFSGKIHPDLENDFLTKYCLCDIFSSLSNNNQKIENALMYIKQSYSTKTIGIEGVMASPDASITNYSIIINEKPANNLSAILLSTENNLVRINLSGRLDYFKGSSVFQHFYILFSDISYMAEFKIKNNFFYYLVINIQYEAANINQAVPWPGTGKYLKGGRVGFISMEIVELPCSGELVSTTIKKEIIPLTLK